MAREKAAQHGDDTKNQSQQGNGGQMAKTGHTPLARTGSLGWSSPFSLMRRFSEEMDRLFEGFSSGRSSWGKGQGLMPHGMEAAWSPQIDVFQRDNQITIRADLPGLNKDDLQIEVTDEAVTIQGERRQEKKEDREGYYCSECSYGSFFRSIPLPEGAKSDEAKASFQNGVLEITVPSTPRSHGGRIEIQESPKA